MNLTTTNSQATGFPLVIATQTQQPTARLQLRNSHGQVIQRWLVKANKCTLGSAASCAVRCELPGVAPYHALVVIGARQVFIRALAPKLTRDGQPFNELLLTDDESHFEIAGHRFELSRNDTEAEPAVPVEACSPQRIKFTLARPFELRNRPQAAQIHPANPAQHAAEMAFGSHSGSDSKWVAQLIQAAMQPLECQLHNLADPLSELQRESRKQRRLRKRRAMRRRNAAVAQPETVTADSLLESSSHSSEHAQLAEQIETMVVKHSAAMELLAERVAHVNQQLLAIERIVTEQPQSNPIDGESQIAPDSPQLTLQSAAIEQLQQSVVSVTSTLERLQAEQVTVREDDQQWKNGLQSQLGGLAHVIEELSASVSEVHLVALRAASQPATNPQPHSNWQFSDNTQADSEALAAPDSQPASLPSTLDAWGLATDELAATTIPSEVESEFFGTSPAEAYQYGTEQSMLGSPEFEANMEGVQALLSEIAQPSIEPEAIEPEAIEPEAIEPEAIEPEAIEPEAIEPEQRMWSTPESDALAAEHTREAESRDDNVATNSTSLPSWWADDVTDGAEPDSELQSSVAAECYAEPRDSHIAKGVEESVSGLDERVYGSTSDVDERISEAVYEAKSQSAADEVVSAADQPSEEFFGLAQLDLEAHLREVVALPHTPLSVEHEPKVAADEMSFEELGSSPLDVEDQTSDKQLAGLEPSVNSQAEEVPVEPQGVENATEVDDSDSVEEYMRKLLARMRGLPENEVVLPEQPLTTPAGASPHTSTPTAAANAQSRSNTQSSGMSAGQSLAGQPTANFATETLTGGVDVTEPFDPEKYMPRALAPERSNSLAAMRELANSSARTAIHKSTRQRHVSSLALKSVITGVGLVVGMVLLAINGLNLNIGLVATVASFLVAAIWGYDTISSIRPMLQHGLVLKPQPSSVPASADEPD